MTTTPAQPGQRAPRPLTLRTITPAEHLDWVRRQPSVSFLQTPAWAQVKPEWRAQSLGWFDGEEMIGAALVLHRQLPRLKRSLAYLPEGPAIDWSSPRLVELLRLLRDHLRADGAFAIRIGPPVVLNRWSTVTVKDAIANEAITSLTQVTPDVVEETGVRVMETLRRLGLRHLDARGGFAAGQPQFLFQLPLAGRSESDLLAGMNQLWRRNIKKSTKLGVEVTHGAADDLPAFHEVYVETAQRDGFTPRPLSYFQTMYAAMAAEEPDRIRLYLARHEGDLVAATLWVRVGEHAWYSYGASTGAKRDVQGSTAIQWQMIRDSLASGATVYDMRGITDGVAGDDPHVGLIRFKVGTGGEAVELAGEWDLALNPLLYRAFDLYMRRR